MHCYNVAAKTKTIYTEEYISTFASTPIPHKPITYTEDHYNAFQDSDDDDGSNSRHSEEEQGEDHEQVHDANTENESDGESLNSGSEKDDVHDSNTDNESDGKSIAAAKKMISVIQMSTITTLKIKQTQMQTKDTKPKKPLTKILLSLKPHQIANLKPPDLNNQNAKMIVIPVHLMHS